MKEAHSSHSAKNGIMFQANILREKCYRYLILSDLPTGCISISYVTLRM